MDTVKRRMSPKRQVLVLVIIGLWVAGSTSASAQFGLPKIPKLPKVSKKETKPSEKATPEVGASAAASVEVSQMSPDSAPPGGSGEVTLTGKGFKEGMTLDFRCQGAQFQPDSIKVTAPDHAVAQISVPTSAKEGPCGLSIASSKTGEPFRISASANMPMVLPVIFLGEGDMNFMQLMPKMQEQIMKAAQGNWQQGQTSQNKPKSQGLRVDSESIKYLDLDGKTVFEEKVSGVKSMGEMTQMNQPTGIFRIVFNDGKIYNFGQGLRGGGGAANQDYLFLKKRLGK
jgi:hypothetical protein